MNSLTILIVCDEGDASSQIQASLPEQHKVNLVSKNDVGTEIDRISPDLIFVIEEDDAKGIEIIQTIQAEYEAAYVIYFSHNQDFVALREVIRAGANDYFVLPEEIDMFAQKFNSIVETAVSQGEDVGLKAFRRGKGKVFSFFSGKGGSGTTLLSLSFAQTLKLESTASVLFIDLNLQYGGAETFLGIEGHRSLVDLVPVMNELNEMHIRNALEFEKHSKLELLLSPCDAEAAEEMNEAFISKLIRTCRRFYDFVIIDLPHSMSVNTYTALEESDKIYYVLTLDTPSFKLFQRIEELFQRLTVQTEERLEFIVNQVSKDNELKPVDLKGLVEYPIALEARKDIKGVQAAVNVGEPLQKSVEDKKLPLPAKDIRKWIRAFLK
ncbi:response regulator [Halalkalibacter urbisdiaboli]|uniref:response regulator n=1 Tax=Halalkalibacter urbisdiaboli TaxID=1960589 RepID=UPI000B43DA90|nr:AAA family ATPase [Halalkalibacter urbisdiaboli]